MILGVSFDSVAANKAFAEKFSFPYPLLCDTDRTIGIAYGAAESATQATAKRISYVIDKNGKVKTVWGKVDVKAHTEEVLAQLD